MTHIDHLPTIGLAELNQRAALLTRVERKYLMFRESAEEVLTDLPSGTRILSIDGRRQFWYSSAYFDTRHLLSFQGTATARRRRWKVRTRHYLDSDACWLEVKTRGPRGSTIKERAPHPHFAADRLTPVAAGFATARLSAARIHLNDDWNPHPVLHTRYRRITLALPDGCSRATIDTRLTWRSEDGVELAAERATIIETKTASNHSALDRALWERGHRPTRISKFGTGMVLLHPELPDHRWHRLMSSGGPLTT